MIYKFNEVILITLYDFDETTDEAVLVRVEGAKTPVPPPTAHTGWSSEAPIGAICRLSQYN